MDDTSFADALADLVDEYREQGVTTEEIMAVMQVRLAVLEEEC